MTHMLMFLAFALTLQTTPPTADTPAPTGVDKMVQEAAAMQREADRARTVIARRAERTVAAAPDIWGGGDRVGRVVKAVDVVEDQRDQDDEDDQQQGPAHAGRGVRLTPS